MVDTPDRVALPIRVHEFLLACAGRIDDDALTDARELLAVAELDRAVELLAGTLIAGRIPVTSRERDLFGDLVGAVRGADGLLDRLVVDDRTAFPRHRFTVGGPDDPEPEEGVAEAAARVTQVLPDIRSMWCVWRTTPAGATAGPIPQRVVLVETGPAGFAPSTAYRVEQALRRSGVRAVVEVLQAGAPVDDYHRDALASARRLGLGQTPGESGSDSPFGDYGSGESPAPRPVTSTRRRAAAHERKFVESASGRWQQRIAAADAGQDGVGPEDQPERPSDGRREPPHDGQNGARSAAAARYAEPSAAPEPEPAPSAPEPEPVAEAAPAQPSPPAESTTAAEPVREDHGLPNPVPPQQPEYQTDYQSEPAERADRAERAQASPAGAQDLTVRQPLPVLPPEPAIAAETHTTSVSNPNRDDPDGDLSQREQELLRQLHEELAKREQVGDEPRSQNGVDWQADHADHSVAGAPAFPRVDYGPGWAASPPDQTMINGIPPYQAP
jgi:hypothetical protein